MERDIFYVALANTIGASQFKMRPTASAILASERFLPLMFTSIDGALRVEDLDRAFDPLRSSAQFLAFKSVLGQPVVAAVIEADLMTHDALQERAYTFSRCLSNCADHTLKCKGLFSSVQAGGTFGFLLCVFFDTASADRFTGSPQKACCITQRKPIAAVRTWAIDVPRQRVIPESRSWFNALGAINPKKFQNELFSIP